MKKNLVRMFAVLGCFAVTGFVVTGCGGKSDEDTNAPAKSPKDNKAPDTSPK